MRSRDAIPRSHDAIPRSRFSNTLDKCCARACRCIAALVSQPADALLTQTASGAEAKPKRNRFGFKRGKADDGGGLGVAFAALRADPALILDGISARVLFGAILVSLQFLLCAPRAALTSPPPPARACRRPIDAMCACGVVAHYFSAVEKSRRLAAQVHAAARAPRRLEGGLHVLLGRAYCAAMMRVRRASRRRPPEPAKAARLRWHCGILAPSTVVVLLTVYATAPLMLVRRKGMIGAVFRRIYYLYIFNLNLSLAAAYITTVAAAPALRYHVPATGGTLIAPVRTRTVWRESTSGGSPSPASNAAIYRHLSDLL